MDVINFKVGSKIISLNILDILLTEQYKDNLTQLPNERKGFLGVKNVMNKAVPVFDLGLILNQQSTKQTNASLLAALTKVEQKYLNAIDFLLAHQDVEELSYAIYAQKPEFPDAWFCLYQTHNEELSEILEQFETPHQRLQELIEAFYLQQKSNQSADQKISDVQEIKLTCAKLNRLFGSARIQLTLDYKPITVFTTKDGITPNIGLLVDKVEDNLNVLEQDIYSIDKMVQLGFDLDEQTKNMMVGLIKCNDKHSVLIDPKALFLKDDLNAMIEEQICSSLDNISK